MKQRVKNAENPIDINKSISEMSEEQKSHVDTAMENNNMNDIIEGNKLIAEFEGYYTTDGKEWARSNKRLVDEYKYHSSWDWLMPVVEKIWQLQNSEYSKEWEDFCRLKIHETIQKVYQAVVEFIKWYNNTQTKYSTL